MIDAWTRCVLPDIQSFQRISSFQGRSIGDVQNSVLVQENTDHPHIFGIGHTIHLEEKVFNFTFELASLDFFFFRQPHEPIPFHPQFLAE